MTVGDKHEEYLAQFSERELKWLETLAKLSPQDTNLKAMRRMDVMTDMPKYCKEHLHLLPPQRSIDFYDLHIRFEQIKHRAYLPGAALGGVSSLLPVLLLVQYSDQTRHEEHSAEYNPGCTVGWCGLASGRIPQQQVVPATDSNHLQRDRRQTTS